MIKKELLAYSLLVLQPIFMASNLVVARGGVEYIPPISLAFWRWLTVFLILLIFNYTIFSKKKIILKEYKKLFFWVLWDVEFVELFHLLQVKLRQ